MKSITKLMVVAMLLVAALVVAPVAAAPRPPISPGGTIYVGEENLDLSTIFDTPSGTLVYAPGESNQKSIRVGDINSFDLLSTSVGGTAGYWYAYNATTAPAKDGAGSVGNVYIEVPSSSLGVVLGTSTTSVDGKSVTRGQSISFRLTNNLEGIAGAEMDIEVTTPGGGTVTTFEGVNLSRLAVTTKNSPTINLTDAVTGTYTAKGVLKDVDKVSGSTGFDTNVVTFEVASGALAITSNKDTVVRNNPFTVTVTGESKTRYNVSVSGTGSDRPMIIDGQTAVKNLYDAYTAEIETNAGGKASIEFNTTQADTKTYTIKVENKAGDLDDEVKVKVEAGSVTITTSGTGTYYIGEEITLFGTNTDSDTVYLFMTGSNLTSNGVNLWDPEQKVTTGDPYNFTIANVRTDDTWSIRWNTAGLSLNAGSYTVYAVTEPRGQNNLADARYATTSLQLRLPFVTATASSATVARGDGLVISGVATGNPANVCIWIFGENYSRLQQPATLWSDGGFEYRIAPEDTASLSSGQYFVVVQHPIDDVFDVWASGTMLAGNGVSPVDLATLSAAEAANALIAALDLPDVDDDYSRLTFFIEDPWIRIDPIGNQTAGSAFTISGTTNLAAGDTLGIRGRGETATAVMQAGVPVPTPTPVPGGSSGAGFGSITTVVKGTGANTWSFNLSMFNLRPGHYTVTVESIETGAFQTAVFDVLEGHEPPSHALALSPGWNFVSVPRSLATGSDTAAIFAGVETDGCSVLRYDTATGQWLALKETDQIGPLEGFWIYSNETATVPLNVSTVLPTPPAERSLSTGWNAVGTMMGATPPSARDALLSVGGQWTTLIGFDVETQDFETAIVSGGSGAYTDSRQVYPGRGYWLYMTEPGTLCAVGA